MLQPCPKGSCYYFVDYLNIGSIKVHHDVVCMYGVYKEPVRGKVFPGYFECDFSFFYSLMTKDEPITNSEKAIEALSKSLSAEDEDERTVELDLWSIVELHDMVIRLSVLHDDESEQCGLFIEDAFRMEKGHFSFDCYLSPPPLPEDLEKEVRVRMLRGFRDMSGHMTSLALRYEYYRYSIRKGMAEEDALRYSSLEDRGVFEAARVAHGVIVEMKEELL